ncbi:hypothetical protein [Streptomyces syringium]|uniref:Uncharacterized protein n=1 Tax=Streptomyces syringium TaxID=76729 RepID=A0ABS4YBK0_9ACTN|nr:hypothetical protein [Streptomyces syringium]MBP2406169.1 hypothetical protein [Streptomyces syringium]
MALQRSAGNTAVAAIRQRSNAQDVRRPPGRTLDPTPRDRAEARGAAGPSRADRMPTLSHALNQVAEGLDNTAGLAADHAAQMEEAVHGALSRALVTLAREGPAASAQRVGTLAAGAATQAAAWATELPGRRVAELLPLPDELSALLPRQTVAELLREVPAAATRAAEAVRGGAATAEEAVHGALGRALAALAGEGPVAGARSAGTSLVEASRWAGGALAQVPSAAQQALVEAVPLPQWCTRLALRWAASYAAAHIYGAARQAGQTVAAIAGELGTEAMGMMDVVDQELRQICAPAEQGPAAGPAAAPELTAEQQHEAQLRAFRATLFGLGPADVEELIGWLTAGTGPLDAEQLAVAREFQHFQRAAAAGGADAYMRDFDAERTQWEDKIKWLRQKQDKLTPSRVLPHAVLPARYRDKHAQQEAEITAAHARLAEIEELRETLVRGSREIGVLQSVLQHVQGPSATNMEKLKPHELAACEQLLQGALSDVEGYGDPAGLKALLDRVRREPDARSMLKMVRARGVGELYALKERMDRLAGVLGAELSERAPGWLERTGLRETDPALSAQVEQLSGQVAEAHALSAEYARLISLYESPEYADRTARAEADLKTFRDLDFRRLLDQEYGEAADRVVAASGNNARLLQAMGILLDRVKGDPPKGLGGVHINILEGMAERLPDLAAAAGPFYMERVDFALLLREVEKELAARRAGPPSSASTGDGHAGR